LENQILMEEKQIIEGECLRKNETKMKRLGTVITLIAMPFKYIRQTKKKILKVT